jgi:hypothetical protein
MPIFTVFNMQPHVLRHISVTHINFTLRMFLGAVEDGGDG